MTAKISAISANVGSLGTNKGEAFRFGDDNSGQLAGFRNRLINGNFLIAQRGLSQSAAGYGSVDRWQFGLSSGSFNAQRNSAFDAGVLATGGNGYFLQLTATAVVSGFFFQPIESVGTLAGKTVTLSYIFNPISGSDASAQPFLRQHFGTGGSPSPNVDIPAIADTTVVISGSISKRTLTYAVPSVAGKVLGSSNTHQLAVFIPFSGTFSKTYWAFQLEEGSIATPFEQRPIGLELSLCQRYFETLTSGALNCFGNNSAFGCLPFKVQKRSSTLSTGGSTVTLFTIYGIAAVSTLGGLTFQGVYANEVHIGVTFAAVGLAASGMVGLLLSNIHISAEL